MSENKAIGVETVGMTMQFGDFTALDNVSIKIRPGTFHTLLGENGAGKSTLVKCIMGFYIPTSGQLMIQDREVSIEHPRAAHAHGLGMVYQHFTLVPSLTGAENLTISKEDSSSVINWKTETEKLEDFLSKMPFRVPLDRPVYKLAAGEKQKLEVIKQLYLGRRFLILDEPTSVLTPYEADELLGMIRELTERKQLTALMITHKFREVQSFGDEVSVLRNGKYAGGGLVSDLDVDEMATMMIGEKAVKTTSARNDFDGNEILNVSNVEAIDRSGLKPVRIDNLTVRSGEVVGIAGVSGNGQSELMEILSGLRPIESGQITVKNNAFHATRSEMQNLNVRYLPEEPLLNACAPQMSVAENISYRNFDTTTNGDRKFWLNKKKIRDQGDTLIKTFNVKTSSPDNPISSLSGGNVQRAVLARELTGEVDLLIISNPCFGLDFSAVEEIRGRIMQARNSGTAVLLISEDLDEILELSDRILVMSDGHISYETTQANADISEIGKHMAGNHA